MQSFKSALLASTILVLGFSSAPVLAQLAPAADDITLGEIIVTAQRKSENLQDVPLSVTAVGGEKLAVLGSGGQDVRFLSARVPSLIIESSFGRTFPRFYIRGLGNTDFDFNASQPVSFVYDDVVLENPILKGFPVFDLDRVEVLRGPQGTLFGRNTPAGIVKFDSVKPSSELSGYGKISYGSFNNLNIEAAAGGPLAGDKLAVRLSALYQRQDDYVDNVLPGRRTENAFEGYSEFAARAQFLIKPTEELNVLLAGQIRSLDGTARLFRANVFTRGVTGLNANFKRNEVSVDGKNEQEVDAYNLSGTVTYDLGAVKFTSVTSYWDGEATSVGDVDGGFGANFLPPNLTGPGQIPFTAETRDSVPNLTQFTQEFRFSGDADALSYQGGFFYFNEKLKIVSENYSTLGDPNNAADGVNILVTQDQKSTAYGIFGNLTYKFTDQFSVTGGLRYNNDKRTYRVVRSRDSQFPGFLQNPLGTVNRAVKDDNITWDVSATFAATDDLNYYARVAKGFRAPSIQGRILFPPATATPLESGVTVSKSETIFSYEAGVKSTFLDGKGRFNFNGFYYDLKNAQLTAVGGGVNANRLLNARSVQGYGFEVDAELRPVPQLRLTAGLSYNHTAIRDANLQTAACGAVRLDTFSNLSLCTPLDPIVVAAAPFSAAIVNINGNSLPQSPRWIGNVTARYAIPVGEGEVFAFTDWAYRSKINFFLYESVEFQDRNLLEGGLRVGYVGANDAYEVAAYVRNITGDTSAVGGIDFNNLTGFVNEPRVWGISAHLKF